MKTSTNNMILVVVVCFSGWLCTSVSSSTNYDLCEKEDIMATEGNIFFNSSSISSEENTTICERTIYAREGTLILSINHIDFIHSELEVFDGVYAGKQLNSTMSGKKKIFKSTGNTMRIVLEIKKSGKSSGFTTMSGNFSTMPFPSTCKCSGVQNGFLRCRDTQNGERKCTAYCNHGFIDLFNTTGDYTCNLLNGKWNNGFKDKLGCVSLPLIPDVKTQVNFTLKHFACNNDTTHQLFNILYGQLVTKEQIRQNSACFKANYSTGECLKISCIDKGDNQSFVSTKILDKATGLWNASGSEELSQAYNASLMRFENMINTSLSNMNESAEIIEKSFTFESHLGCPPETFSMGPKSTCSVCPQGSFYKPAARTCEKCPYGTFSSKDFTRCVPEKTNNVSAELIKCEVKCESGKELNEKTGFCQWCPRNSYKNDSAKNCSLCPDGKLTLYRGSVSVDACNVPCNEGTFFDVTTNKCLLCPLGTFQNSAKHLFTRCNRCSGGKVTYTPGSKDPSDCVPSCGIGHFFDDKSRNCTKCPIGSYQNSTNQMKCLKCPYGTSTISTGTNNGSGCVKVCQPGTYYNVQNGTCFKCSLGTFMDKSDHLLTSCKNCSEGKVTYTEGAADEAKCYNRCKTGQFFDASQSACVNCTLGTYQNGTNQLQCVKCPDGTSTRSTGSSNKEHCIKTCSKGTYFDPQKSSCEGCPSGYFMEDDGHLMEECQKCAEKKTTYVQSATNVSQCQPICTVGKYFNKSASLCQECAKGFFQDKLGQASCVSCPPGMSTKRTGATSQLDCLREKIVCDQGEFYNAQNRSCVLCEEGTYQSAVNHNLTSCQSCLSGRTNGRGAKSNASCIAGCDESVCKNNGTCVEINQAVTCKCLPGFVGKHCEVIEKEGKDKDNLQRVESSVRFTSLEWSKDLENDASDEYKKISSTIEKALNKVFEQDSTVVDVKVRRLRSGSVIADFDIFVANNASLVPAKSLQLAVSQGSVGGLPVDSQYLRIRQVTCSQPLGMENGQIKDENIIGSGQGKGRLNGEPWRAGNQKDNLQVQFNSVVNVTALAIQGDGKESFVRSYSLAYSKDSTDWFNSMDTNHSKIKVYQANTDSNSIVKQVFQQPIASVKFIRVTPVSHEKAIAMRIELYGCMADPVLKMEVVPTRPSQTEEPVKTNPNVQGSKSEKDEYAWGKYLGIAFGIIMAIVVVGACFIWWSKRRKQKEDTPLVLTRYQDGSYREIAKNDDEEEEAV